MSYVIKKIYKYIFLQYYRCTTSSARSRSGLPSSPTRVHTLRSSTATSASNHLCTKLWCYQHHHSTTNSNRWSLPRLSCWYPRRRLHLSRYTLCYSILPSRNTLLPSVEESKVLQLWSNVRLILLRPLWIISQPWCKFRLAETSCVAYNKIGYGSPRTAKTYRQRL
jgi:hypothetical protein